MRRAMSSLDIDLLEETVLEAIWIQWKSIGSFIDAPRLARTMIDPEALLLVSLTLRHREKRLWDVLISWARHGSKLFSVQRVKNLLGSFPDLTKTRLAEFANRAWVDGNDFRWRSLSGAESGPTERNHELWKAYPSNWESSALVLRLRLGIGVGVVSDLLSLLISLQGGWASARLIAQATNYTVNAIRRVADDLAAAQLIESTQAKPVQYRVNIATWCDLMNIGGELPEWRFWYQVYAFTVGLIIANERGDMDKSSSYLLSSVLRDVYEHHRETFLLNQIDFADPKRYSGAEYLPAFSASIANLATWIKTNI